jgi:hypothetical protein
MAKKLDELGFKSSVADPDVWMRPATRVDGETYYEYVLMYVDDILLAISANPMPIIEDIQRMVKFKNDDIKEPSNYLGTKLQNKSINGAECWTVTSADYVKAAIENVKEGIKGMKWILPTKLTTPMV